MFLELACAYFLCGSACTNFIDTMRSLPIVRHVARLPALMLRELIAFDGQRVEASYPEFHVVRVNGQFLHLSPVLYNVVANRRCVDVRGIFDQLRGLDALKKIGECDKLS